MATAQARDDEMRHRIERHQEQRRARLPGMRTIEEPLALDRVIRRYSRPERLLVIDCLTLWLANQLARHEDVVPPEGAWDGRELLPKRGHDLAANRH